MKSSFLMLLIGCVGTTSVVRARSVTQVTVEPRAELYSVIFRLAGHPEYSKTVLPFYRQRVDQYFGRHREHAAVKLAQELRLTRHVGYGAPMNLVVHENQIKEGGGRPESLDPRWHLEEARRFALLADDFARQTHFDRFFGSQTALYQDAIRKLEALLMRQASLGWFDTFFGYQPRTEFRLVISPMNGVSNYAAWIKNEKESIYYCFLGVYQVMRHKNQAWFDARVLPTVVHEFCHAYCNPLVEVHLPALQASGKRLFFPVHDQMTKQAYGSWQAMMMESLVRASTVRYQFHTRGMIAAEQEAAQHYHKGFLWIRELAEELSRYEQDRETYPTLKDFFPEIIRFYDNYTLPSDS